MHYHSQVSKVPYFFFRILSIPHKVFSSPSLISSGWHSRWSLNTFFPPKSRIFWNTVLIDMNIPLNHEIFFESIDVQIRFSSTTRMVPIKRLFLSLTRTLFRTGNEEFDFGHFFRNSTINYMDVLLEFKCKIKYFL